MIAESPEFIRGEYVNQEEVANGLGVTRSAYVHYEQGDRECSFDALRKLSSIFNVTTDYLLGVDKSNLPAKDETTLLERYRKLTDEGKQTILALMGQMAQAV